MPALNPPKCSHSVMSYIPTIGPVLLDSGSYPTYNSPTNLTYKWDGSNWTTTINTVTDPLGPLPTRTNAASSQLQRSTTIVVFGGKSSTDSLNDTWVFNGTTWTQANPAISPPSRFDATMSCGFSSLSDVLLFGGRNERNVLGDTWLWNGTTWTKQVLASSPSARYGAKLAGGILTSRESILFGGADDSTMFNDTYQWNDSLATWTRLSPANSPSARIYHSMCVDNANSSNIVLFGGKDGSNIFNDTWIFDGTNWIKQYPANSPSYRFGAQMAYDFNSASVILFGGKNESYDFNDTWKWTGTNWIQL